MSPDPGLADIERAAVKGWPALETEAVDGWLVRASSGGSVRANSVSALDYTGADIGASIGRVVAFYRARNARPCFTVTDVSAPAGLDVALAARGWQRHGEHVTMAKDVAAVSPVPSVAPGIEVIQHEAPTPEWLAVYLEGLSGDRRAVAPRIVAGVPAPRMFFSAVRQGRVIASGLSVHDGALASVQCMATVPEARRTGAARAVLGSIEELARDRGRRRLYLQAECANTAATTLYASIGFRVAGRYHTRDLAD
ncbi:MAG: GNAT family N-acetyltransferase [Hyphomicrobiaceae bacterium]